MFRFYQQKKQHRPLNGPSKSTKAYVSFEALISAQDTLVALLKEVNALMAKGPSHPRYHDMLPLQARLQPLSKMIYGRPLSLETLTRYYARFGVNCGANG